MVKGIRCDSGIASFHKGSLEITLTVPLIPKIPNNFFSLFPSEIISESVYGYPSIVTH